MIIDVLGNAHLYEPMHPLFKAAFDYIRNTDLLAAPCGKTELMGKQLIAIIQTYDTMPAEQEQMEAHRQYIDIQYIISGSEKVGHSLLTKDHVISREYNAQEDYLLVPNTPDFFSLFGRGNFMIFYPHDLHMPCIQVEGPSNVKKLVLKVAYTN